MAHRKPRTPNHLRRGFLVPGACKHCGRTHPCSCSVPERSESSPEACAQRRVRVLGAHLFEAYASNDRERVVSVARSVLNIVHAMAGFPDAWELPAGFVHEDDLDQEAIPSVGQAMNLCFRVLAVQRLDGEHGAFGARLYLIAFSSLMVALDAGLALGGGNGGDRAIENPEM